MRERIRRITELIHIKPARNFRGQPRGHILIVFGMAASHVGPRHDHFGAERFDVRDFFLRHLVGDNENDSITFRAGNQRQTETGVSRRRFDHGPARLQFSLLLGRLDHSERDAIFDRAGRILIFQFNEKLAGTGIDPRDLDERRIANE